MQKKLAIYMPDLSGGGAERQKMNLMKGFREAGYDISFVLHQAKGELMGSTPEGVSIVSLKAMRTIEAFFPLVQYLKNERPDIILSSLGHNNILALWANKYAGSPSKVVVCQHSSLSSESADMQKWQHKVLPLLYRLFLGWADGIVAVSRGVADEMARVTKTARNRISVILNPVIYDGFDARATEACTHPWLNNKTKPVILAVGRLVEQKDFETLIKSFAKLKQKIAARLIILGEGPNRDKLQSLAATLGVAADLDMPGYIKNPLPAMRTADILVMSSLYEGFGNVLVEALACGTQVVSTNCPFGPDEILDHGKYGTLVPIGDSLAMAEAIAKALRAPVDKATLIARGHEYSSARSVSDYCRLFDNITTTRR